MCIRDSLGEMLLAAAEGRIADYQPTFSNKSAVTVVLASEGYPGPSKTGREITGENTRIEEGEIVGFVHQAGTSINDEGKLVSSGGRVLSATAVAPELSSAVDAAYAIIEEINLQGSHYRGDIAYRAL